MKPATHLIMEDGSHSPNCFPCKVRSVSFAPSAMPTRSPEAARASKKDPELHRNMESYVRLRKEGMQPKSLHTAAQMEKQASEKFEVETGRLVADPSERRQYADAFANTEPQTTPLTPEQSTEIKEAREAGRRQRA